ncbi:MAG: hypothetical protein JSR60_06895 [Proteobacteria bacterium]|nr:hypothetical protein [Pseudomonadota bacterium]
MDDGDNWSVFVRPTVRRWPGHQANPNVVTVSAGGGMLVLEIAKCDGALKASYSR